ncbi:hypothetical protein [Natrinema salaciae]|uniref:Uncharacterized protein n=1 Tax=Natrinema salaciae TaxID=1186196 RepID=A0A1H9IPH8_9EURY|nr:hypothetical protein [Natrinema salaciae]SEQ76494.1 hypothetical protein SAMN04489841_2295 [Natrinema salaciae]
MGRGLRGTAEWLLEPSTTDGPAGMQILGVLALLLGAEYGFAAITTDTTLGTVRYIFLGGWLLAAGWGVVTGRPIGLAGGFLAWSFQITSGFFGLLESGTVTDHVDLLLASGTAAGLWIAGVWVLYRNRDFFLEHTAPEPKD